MLRVDKNKAVTLPYGDDRVHMLINDEAEAMVEQFRAGNRLAIRFWIYPDCTSNDMTFTLKGFTAAWKQLEAEGG